MSKDLLLFYKLKYSDCVFKLKNKLEDNFDRVVDLEVFDKNLSKDTLDDLFLNYKYILFIVDKDEQDIIYNKFHDYKNYSERILFLSEELKQIQKGERFFYDICMSINMKLKELGNPQNEYEYLIDQYKKHH